jgi:hypothetical protein
MHALPVLAAGLVNVLGKMIVFPAWWMGVAAAAVVILVALLLVRWMRTGRKVRRQPEPDLFVDVGQLDPYKDPASNSTGHRSGWLCSSWHRLVATANCHPPECCRA